MTRHPCTEISHTGPGQHQPFRKFNWEKLDKIAARRWIIRATARPPRTPAGLQEDHRSAPRVPYLPGGDLYVPPVAGDRGKGIRPAAPG